MIVTAMKAVIFIVFFGITVGLVRPSPEDIKILKKNHKHSQQVYINSPKSSQGT